MHDIRQIRDAPARLRRRPRPPRPAAGRRRNPRPRRDPPRPHRRRRDRPRRAQRRQPRRSAPPRRAATRPSSSACARSSPKGRTRSPRLEAEAAAADAALRDLLMGFPNLPMDDVPDGPDETANVEIRRWGHPRNFSHKPLEHYEIPGRQGRPRLRGRRPAVRRPLRGDEGRDDPPAPRARPVHARHPRRASTG